jgi:phage baseplate assembly protein W
MALPEIAGAMDFKVTTQPTKTYAVDFENGRIAGTTDGLAAMVQAVRKALCETRYAQRIYSGDYGSELGSLIGKPYSYVRAKARMLIEDALAADERVRGIRKIEVTKAGVDAVLIHAYILTEYGEIYVEHGIRG